MRHKLVLIEWLDSKGVTSQWEHWDDIEPLEPNLCTSIGFLIEETESYKTIAQSISDSQVIGRTTIPCCSIQKIHIIEQ